MQLLRTFFKQHSHIFFYHNQVVINNRTRETIQTTGFCFFSNQKSVMQFLHGALRLLSTTNYFIFINIPFVSLVFAISSNGPFSFLLLDIALHKEYNNYFQPALTK